MSNEEANLNLDEMGNVAVLTISNNTKHLSIHINARGGYDGWEPLDVCLSNDVDTYLAENSLVKIHTMEHHTHHLAGIYAKGTTV